MNRSLWACTLTAFFMWILFSELHSYSNHYLFIGEKMQALLPNKRAHHLVRPFFSSKIPDYARWQPWRSMLRRGVKYF